MPATDGHGHGHGNGNGRRPGAAVALDFHSHIAGLAAQRGQAHLRDQLARASLSIVLNIAEGVAGLRPAKGRFYAIARGTACECAAILDIIERSDGLPLNGRIARSLLVRIVQMLTRLGASMRIRCA